MDNGFEGGSCGHPFEPEVGVKGVHVILRHHHTRIGGWTRRVDDVCGSSRGSEPPRRLI